MKPYEPLVSRNVRLESVVEAKYPFITQAIVGADICLGKFGRCALCFLKGQQNDACGPTMPLLRSDVVAGFGTDPADNFFYAALSGTWNVNRVLEILELPTVCAMLYAVIHNVMRAVKCAVTDARRLLCQLLASIETHSGLPFCWG